MNFVENSQYPFDFVSAKKNTNSELRYPASLTDKMNVRLKPSPSARHTTITENTSFILIRM